MGEFSQIMQIVAEQIKSASPQMEVVNAFPNVPRNNPQKENLAVLGIQKVSLQPIGFEDFVVRAFRYEAKSRSLGQGLLLLQECPAVLGKLGARTKLHDVF